MVRNTYRSCSSCWTMWQFRFAWQWSLWRVDIQLVYPNDPNSFHRVSEKKSSCYFFWNFCLECRTFTCVNFFTTSRATICSKTVCRYGFSINVNLSLSRCQTSTLVSSSAVAEIWKRSSAATPNHSGESTKWSRGTTWSNLPDCLTKKLAKEQTIKKWKQFPVPILRNTFRTERVKGSQRVSFSPWRNPDHVSKLWSLACNIKSARNPLVPIGKEHRDRCKPVIKNFLFSSL